jgi:hypothetical protein
MSERCEMCGATGAIPERRCACRHHVCAKCWNENGPETLTGCPACDGLVEEAAGCR